VHQLPHLAWLLLLLLLNRRLLLLHGRLLLWWLLLLRLVSRLSAGRGLLLVALGRRLCQGCCLRRTLGASARVAPVTTTTS
jgi:hypothetical protein